MTTTTYKSYEQNIKGNNFSITVASGRSNYVMVTKKTNNPFGGVFGKTFSSFDKAASHYKSPEMKTFILQVEMNLLQPKEQLIAEF